MATKKTLKTAPVSDIIDRLEDVKTDVDDYFVIIEAINEIHQLRGDLKETQASYGLRYEEGYGEGYEDGNRDGFKNGFNSARREFEKEKE
jgi:hypothetical protein